MALNGWQIALICWVVFGMLVRIAYVGKERKPLTPTDAVVGAVESILLVGIIILAGR